MHDSQRPRWYSVDGRSLPDMLRGENYADVADLLEKAEDDQEKTVAALIYGIATTSGEPKAILQQMLAGYRSPSRIPRNRKESSLPPP